jgi:hypothetical protein
MIFTDLKKIRFDPQYRCHLSAIYSTDCTSLVTFKKKTHMTSMFKNKICLIRVPFILNPDLRFNLYFALIRSFTYYRRAVLIIFYENLHDSYV